MLNLLASLREADTAVRIAVAKTWSVNIEGMNDNDAVTAIHEAMSDPDKAETVWDKLSDQQRQALQMVIGSAGHKIKAPMFERIHGKFRKLGPGAVQREQPEAHPQSAAEALYYRGLIFEGFENAPTGAVAVVYVPPDLADLLPTQKTAYDGLEAGPPPDAALPIDDAFAPRIESIELEEDEETIAATTTIVDDMATLLAHLQVFNAELVDGGLSDNDVELLLPHLLDDELARLRFLFGVGVTAELIDVQDQTAYPRRAETRRWLESSRAEQLAILAAAWKDSVIFRDLWHVAGLHPEPTGWPYDPVVARDAILAMIGDFTPQEAWWSLDDFITTVKEIEPDFQRPSGDYESWYIRNDAGEYLNGFESWDAVEGALLDYVINGPLHWLGTVDLAMDAARLTAYGRAFVGTESWPNVPDQPETISVAADGTLTVSRRVPRFDRFQAMRFTDWIAADERDGYTLKLNAEGIRRAAEQGINTGHIEAFVSRMLDNGPLPGPIKQLLETWQEGASAAVTLERLLVLRTTAPETMDAIYNAPPLRRYLGARLGPMAAVVRADQWDALIEALGAQGIEVEARG